MTSSRLLLCLLTFVLGCEAPTVDEDPVGGSPPSGAIEGTALYAGPRPTCEYDGETPTRVQGNIVLLLFYSDNPPAPTGSATSAENLLIIPGDEIFTVDDCLPAVPTPDDLRVPLTRSVGFTWPDIALAAGPTPDGEDPPDVPIYRAGNSVDYQVRGFLDRDEDFNPLFSVRRLATRGDVAGGAFVNTQADPPQFSRVTFSNAVEMPDGQVVSGVAVTLAGFVNTELPASSLTDATQALSAEATVPSLPDAIAREEALWQLTQGQLSLIDPQEESWSFTLRAAGMQVDSHPSGYGYFSFAVDADRDGAQDPHPTLGSAGIQWAHPIVILRRARNPFELAVGVPDVVIVASTRPSQTLAKDTFSRNIDIAIPPVAVMNLDPENPICQVAVVAPGNLAETYERIPADCQEIPTGNYDVNVLSGLAGGSAINYRAQIAGDMPELPPEVLETIVRTRTDNDWVIEGGSFSSQAWSIPNELGCPDPYRPNAFDEDGSPITVSQLDPNPLTNCGDPTMGCDSSGTLMQCSQGPNGRFAVVDPDVTNAPITPDHSDGHGVASCQTAVRAATLMPDAVTYMPVPSECCGGIQHLCDLPLCETRDAAARAASAGGRAVREITAADLTVDESGARLPTCIPFLMPASCCGG